MATDGDSAQLSGAQPVVLRVSSSNVGTRSTLALLSVIVSVLSFFALQEPRLWFVVAFFALPSLHLVRLVFFPHDLVFQVDPQCAHWTTERRGTARVSAADVSAVHVSWKIADDPSWLELRAGGGMMLPDTLFMEADADPERLCSDWAALWPRTPIYLRKYAGSDVQLFLGSERR